LLLAVGFLATGASVLTHRALAQKQASEQQAQAAKPEVQKQNPPKTPLQPEPFENEFGYS
jgi:hypothetical protein